MKKYPTTYLQLEKQLETEIGKDKLAVALNQLEQEYGLNGEDLYKLNAVDILLEIIWP